MDLWEVVVIGVPSLVLSAITLGRGGRIFTANTATRGALEMVRISPIPNGTSPTFHVCRNYFNDTACIKPASGEFSRAMSVSNLVEQCTNTLSLSHTTPVSSTVTPAFTETVRLSASTSDMSSVSVAASTTTTHRGTMISRFQRAAVKDGSPQTRVVAEVLKFSTTNSGEGLLRRFDPSSASFPRYSLQMAPTGPAEYQAIASAAYDVLFPRCHVATNI